MSLPIPICTTHQIPESSENNEIATTQFPMQSNSDNGNNTHSYYNNEEQYDNSMQDSQQE